MDRISNLSDDLLLKILSSLTSKDLAATMLLSKRWKFLWTLVPRLHFDDSIKEYFREEDCVPYRMFQQYVDRFLVSNKSPVLETLKFSLGCWYSSTDDMATWIRIAIARRVREIEIYRALDYGADDYEFELAECLYTFEKLVVLKLYKSITLDVPMEVCLSSLRSLHLLSVQYKNEEESLGKLLNGCPVLEELVMDLTENDAVRSVYVITPSLRRLSILDKFQYQDSIRSEPHFANKKVVIDVPSLIYLSYVDVFDYGHLCLSENMPEVVDANVKLVCKSPEKLMRSITSVKRLSLCLYGSMLQHRIGFYQLVYLELCGCGPKWWDLLTRMLESSPKLQVLKLNKCEERIKGRGGKPSSIEPIKGRWEKPSSVPECLLFHLNTFEWKYYNGRREEKKLVAYILKNARRLKTAAFSNREEFWRKMGTRQCKKLVSLPRASGSCQLLLD